MPDSIVRDEPALPELRVSMSDVVELAQQATRGESVCPCTHMLGTPELGACLDADLDHVCPEVMMGTVLIWAKLEQMKAPWLNPGGDLLLQWPLAYDHRRLILVIRQWVLEPKLSPALARRIDADANWQALVARMREEPRFLEALSTVASTTPEDAWRYFALHQWLRTLLAREGLPAAPEVLLYLKRSVLGERNPRPPRRGVLVSTLVFAAPPGFRSANWRFPDGSVDKAALKRAFSDDANAIWHLHDGNPVAITVGLHEGYDAVSKEVEHTLANHRAFLRHINQAPFASRGAVNRANAGVARERKTLDYMKEALDENAIEGIVRRCILERLSDPRVPIGEHIEKCNERVGRRRDRAEPRERRDGAWKQKGYVAVEAQVKRRLLQEGCKLYPPC